MTYKSKDPSGPLRSPGFGPMAVVLYSDVSNGALGIGSSVGLFH